MSDATTVPDACRAALDVITAASGAMCTVMLPVDGHLRCVAATGSWQVLSTVPPDVGVIGRVYTSGKPEAITNVGRDLDYRPVGPDTRAEVCVPLVSKSGATIGVLNMEWSEDIDAA